MLATGPKARGFKPGWGQWTLRAINIRSMTSFRQEVSLRFHVVRFYGILKNPAEYEKDISSAKFTAISRQVLLLRYLASLMVTARELWWMNRELLELKWGTAFQKWLQCMGCLVLYQPLNININSMFSVTVTLYFSRYFTKLFGRLWVSVAFP
jgi:hypothetical protein